MDIWEKMPRFVGGPVIRGIRSISGSKATIRKRRDKHKYLIGQIESEKQTSGGLRAMNEISKMEQAKEIGKLEMQLTEQTEDLIEAIEARQKAEKKTREVIERTRMDGRFYREACADYVATAITGDNTHALAEKTFGALNINDGLVRIARGAQEDVKRAEAEVKQLRHEKLERLFYAEIKANQLQGVPAMAYSHNNILMTPKFEKLFNKWGEIPRVSFREDLAGDVNLNGAIDKGRDFSKDYGTFVLNFVPGKKSDPFTIAYMIPKTTKGRMKKYITEGKRAVREIYQGVRSQRELNLGLS